MYLHFAWSVNVTVDSDFIQTILPIFWMVSACNDVVHLVHFILSCSLRKYDTLCQLMLQLPFDLRNYHFNWYNFVFVLGVFFSLSPFYVYVFPSFICTKKLLNLYSAFHSIEIGFVFWFCLLKKEIEPIFCLDKFTLLLMLNSWPYTETIIKTKNIFIRFILFDIVVRIILIWEFVLNQHKKFEPMCS